MYGTCFSDPAGPFLLNSAKKYELVGVVLLLVVRMRDKYCAMFVVRVPGLQLIPSVSCAMVRERSPTVSSHPTGLNDVKDDFIIPSLYETVTTK